MAIQGTEIPNVSAGGLVTVAFLKARLDEGSDHLGIFEPLVSSAVAQIRDASFVTEQIQEAIAASHGVAMPQATVATLLRRATRKGYLIREHGRYKRNPSRPVPSSNLAAEKAKVEGDLTKLAEALQKHAEKRKLLIPSPAAALDLLFQFLEKEQVAILLGSIPENKGGSEAAQRAHIIIADFLRQVIGSDLGLESVLRAVLEGLVLYHAAFLPELASIKHDFNGLRVAFDSTLVRQALGYDGTAMSALMRETLGLLDASGARCFVFDDTIAEIRRILAAYEANLGTTQGRQRLRPTAMARHFLTQRYTPSDMREMSALLERDILAAGFTIQQTPSHVAEFTASEERLARRLADPHTKDETLPRVIHDVNCAAAVLTLRKGHRSSTLDDARAILATSSVLLVQNTRLWWAEDEKETSIPPVVHARALTNLAWLKNPAISAGFKIRELVAMCAAALRPSPETWRRFLQHLESLQSSHRISSDEAAAIVVSSMSDQLLIEAEMAEDPRDIDATTLDDIVERVKASYGAKEKELKKAHETELSAAEAAQHSLAEHIRQKELRIRAVARRCAEIVTYGVQWSTGILLLIGALGLMTGHPWHAGIVGVTIGVGIAIFVLVELLQILGHVRDLRVRMQAYLENRVRTWLGGDSGASSISAVDGAAAPDKEPDKTPKTHDSTR